MRKKLPTIGSKWGRYTLIVVCLLWTLLPTTALAKQFTIYFRDAGTTENPTPDNEAGNISLYACAPDGTNFKQDGTVEEDRNNAWNNAFNYNFNTTTIGKKTYKTFSFNTDQNFSYKEGATKKFSSINIILRRKNGENVVQTVDIKNINTDCYFETQGELKKSEDGQPMMIIHELRRAQAEGNSVSYWVKAFVEGQESTTAKEFEMRPVRNQEPGYHTTNTALFNVGIDARDLPGSNGSTIDFYIEGSDGSKVRPWGDYDFTDTQNNGYDQNIRSYYQHYDNCTPENANNGKVFKIKRDDNQRVSYTINYNSSAVFDYAYHAGCVGKDHNPNKPTGIDGHTLYGRMSVGIYMNKALQEDQNGYTLIGNTVDLSDPNAMNQGTSIDATWHPDNKDNQRPMHKCGNNTSYIIPEEVGEQNDVVYAVELDKPATDFNTMFYNVAPNSVLNDKTKAWGGEKKDGYNVPFPTSDKWNYIIRPQVQASKDATATHGCIEILPEHEITQELTVDNQKGTYVKSIDDNEEAENADIWRDNNHASVSIAKDHDGSYMNRSQAFNTAIDNETYSKYTFYINLSRSTYTVIPNDETIDLIGSAVGIVDRAERKKHEDHLADPSKEDGNINAWHHGQWENGERQYHYVPMARNTAKDYTETKDGQTLTTKCWEYTGMFYQEDQKGSRNGGGQIGFRFLTNQSYLKNYIEDSYRPNYFTEEQKTASDYEEKLTVNNPYYNEVRIDPYNGQPQQGDYPVAYKENGKETYNPNGKALWASLGAEKECGYHLGFPLKDGVYTMRFWQTRDANNNIVRTWYTLQDVVKPPSPVNPKVVDVPENTYNHIKAFSSSTDCKKPEWMKVWVVTGFRSDNVLQLKELSYIPKNTGLIIAYTDEDAVNAKSDVDKKNGEDYSMQFVNEDLKKDQKFILDKYPTLDLTPLTDEQATTYYDTNKSDIDANLLVPTCSGAKTINTTEYSDNEKTEVKTRNYLFVAFRAKNHADDEKFKLCFKRVLDNTTLKKNSAYLTLPANKYIGTKETNSDDKVSGSEASTEQAQKSKEFFGWIDWDNTVTGVKVVPVDNTSINTPYFTLQGVALAKPVQSGVYIHNGKKIIVK